MKAELDKLREELFCRYKTAHAFCRDNPEIKRSTLYMLLSGKYPGNIEKQVQRINAILFSNAAMPLPRLELTATEAYTVLQDSKCAHCRKLDKRACADCKTQTAKEAQALENYLRLRAF